LKKLILITLLLGAILIQSAFADVSIMTIDEIESGMTGTGKTVFRGTEIEEFNIEIISVMKNAVGPGHDMILAKALGDRMAHYGSVQGMSGSPIYIDGKLIGAFAYGWPLMTETIIGITPISEMLELYDRAGEELGSNTNEPTDSFYFEKTEDFIQLTEDYQTHHSNPIYFNGTELMPTKTPLIFSGMNPKVFQKVKPIFEEMGFSPMQGGGVSDSIKNIKAELKPGAAVGGLMVSGDMEIFGLGTLTYINGDTLLAFGHPMFNAGDVQVPMAGGYIHTIMPSLMHSYKMGAPTQTVGTIIQDRTTAIMGKIGEMTEMMPLDLTVQSPGTGRENSYHYNILKTKSVMPWYTMICLFQSLAAYESIEGKYTISVDATINIADHPDVKIHDFLSSEAMVAVDLAFKIGGTLGQILNNPFQKAQIQGIDVSVDFVSEKVQNATVKGIRLNKSSFRPGETVDITVMLDPYNQDEVFHKYKFKIPEDAPEGQLILVASSATEATNIERERAPYRFVPESLDQLIQLFNEQGNSRDVELQFLKLEIGATIKGKEFPSIPPSMLNIISESTQTGMGGINIASIYHRDKIRTNYNIQGFNFIRLKIDRNAK
jgi:hypothetical protein